MKPRYPVHNGLDGWMETAIWAGYGIVIGTLLVAAVPDAVFEWFVRAVLRGN